MTNSVPQEITQALDFVDSVDLPDSVTLDATESEPLNLLPPSFDAPEDQAVTIGSQIAGFAAAVDPALRPHISNAFLLAQLAANKHLAVHGGSSRVWYDRYIDVMKNIGWVLEGDAMSTREVKGSKLQVHKEIIPVITTILGPAVAASAAIISVLNGLAAMNKDTPWITLFSRESQRATANQFQISYTSIEGGHPLISLVGFELDASGSVTQVLFFKFGATAAKLTHFDVKMSVNSMIFDSVKDVIRARIAAHINKYIADIDI